MHHNSKKRGKENYHPTLKASDKKDHELLQSLSHKLTHGWMISYPKGKRSQPNLNMRSHRNNLTSLADAAIVEYDDNDVYYGNVKEIIDGCEIEATEEKTPCFSNNNTMKLSDDNLAEEDAMPVEIILSFRKKCVQKMLPSASIGPDSSIQKRDDISHSSLVQNGAIKIRNATIMNCTSSSNTRKRKRANNTTNHIQFEARVTKAQILQNGHLSNGIKKIKKSEFDNNVQNNTTEAMKAPNQSYEDLEADCLAIAKFKCALDKMDLLVEELKRLDKDTIETQNSNSPTTNLYKLKEIYASVTQEWNKVTKQACSAQKNLRSRNKYFHDISSKVSEKIESLSKKAEAMVDKALQEEGNLTNTSDRSELQPLP